MTQMKSGKSGKSTYSLLSNFDYIKCNKFVKVASMSPALFITAYLSASLICGLTAAIAATGRGRHSGYWLIAAFLFPPSVLLLFLLPRGKGNYIPGRDPFEDADDRDRLL